MLCEFSQLFEEKASSKTLIELEDRHGSTALFTAIRVNRPECLKILISYRCNVFHRRKNGNTCLHECALYPASADCLHLLTPFCGAELFQVINREGRTALDVALRNPEGAGTETVVALQKM